MPFTPVGQQAQNDDSPRVYVNPPDMIGHLLLVWPVDYQTDVPTKYPKKNDAGQVIPSDAVFLDIVDLNLPGEDGGPGFVMRRARWTQGRLIRDTKHAVGIGRDQAMLVQMTKDGDAYQIVDQSTNPGAVQYAEGWLAAHPQFQPGDDGPHPQPQGPAQHPTQPQQHPAPQQPQWAPPVSGPPTPQQSAMDRLRRAAGQPQVHGDPLPPAYPGSGQQEEQPPF